MISRSTSRRRRPALSAAVVLMILLAGSARAGGVRPPAADPDDTFFYRHPRLLFSSLELPALRTKVRDGGVDDDAYAFIRQRFLNVYLNAPFDSLLQEDSALEPIVNIAIAAWFEVPVDAAAIDLGRRLTLHIARNFGVDTDPFGTSLRLRALSIGLDCFFADATPAERDEIRAEVQPYITYMSTNLNYDIWKRRPYVSNKTAMVSGALGLAGIAFQEEIDPSYTSAALAAADDFYHAWRDTHLVGDGCYREGSLYIGWSLRNLIYYFAARKRFDGVDYSLEAPIRAVEQWVPYEIDPRGDGRANNIQDQTDYFRPLARHSTYWAWAQSEWSSALAAYVWDHVAGAFGKDLGDEADKAATVLWHTGVAPVNPGQVLPRSRVWEDRGLYYFRTGWPDGAASDDVVFSFYSGEFRGGHAQEEQNQFTLAAYGEKLVLDHGAGPVARQTEAHNLVRIDGNGQHNAGGSIGTDGRISAFVTADFADYVCGDATLAYSTHSPYNNHGVPYPWSDWSWGLYGANPVEYALRRIVAMHGAGAPPYFVVNDDILKDGGTHRYDWCLHVPAAAVVDIGADPASVVSGGAKLYLYPLNPSRADLTASATPFDNYSEDPNSTLLMMSTDDIDPHFVMVLIPLPSSGSPPAITRIPAVWGARSELAWGNGVVDIVFAQKPIVPGAASAPEPAPAAQPCPGDVDSDARLGVVRTTAGTITGYAVAEATWLACGGEPLATIEDEPTSLVYDGTYVHLSRAQAQFHIRKQGVTDVLYRGTPVPTRIEGDYITNATPTGVTPAPAPRTLSLRAFPNPFNPYVRISFVNPARGAVSAAVYDASGRRVATLSSRVLGAGEQTLGWNGRDGAGRAVASGVYFLRVSAAGLTETNKLILLR